MGQHIVVVGGGVGGLVSAALLASRGLDVTLCEAAATPGGKLRGIDGIDAGPTVFTLRDVFDGIFEACGASLDDHLDLRTADVLARHAWSDGSRLDLHADPTTTESAIAEFAGTESLRGYRAFRAEAARLHRALDTPFLRGSKTDPITLGWRMGLRGFPDYLNLRAYTSMWTALGKYLPDPRLRQLFGRYATYCGSSPFETPATLMLIADVEAAGVWSVSGGMHRLAYALAALATRAGVQIRYDTPVSEITAERGRVAGVVTAAGERIAATQVIVNADPAALGDGRFGAAAARAVGMVPRSARSNSAIVWCARGTLSGIDPAHHNVFFSDDYPAEFADLKAGRVPTNPSVYVCSQADNALQILINAPPDGDTNPYSLQETDRCRLQMQKTLTACGVAVDAQDISVQTPADFERLNRSTGGALYGRASHGWAASFRRQGSRTKMPGLYCAGGSTHPGAGVPMAALSGQLASAALLLDRGSTVSSRPAVTAGGMSTRSATAELMG